MRGDLRLECPPNHQRLINVARVRVVCEQLANDRQRLANRQSLGRGGELPAHFDMRLALGQASQRGGRRLRHEPVVAEQAHGPGTHVRVGVPERLCGEFRIEPAAQIHRPKRLERRLAKLVAQHVFEQRERGDIPPIGQ